MFFEGEEFALPIFAGVLSGLGLVMWVFNREAPDDPGGRLWRDEQQRRRKLGLCLRCGYDLTANVSGVCPECGTEIEKP
jgi:hypothetical protein